MPRLAPLIAVLVLVGVGTATAPPGAGATKPCWERVFDDWLDDGTIDRTYKPACYQEALKHVPEDLRDYTDVVTAISVALQDALGRAGSSGGGRGGVPGTSSDEGSSGEFGTGGASTTEPGLRNRTLQHAPNRSIYRHAVDKLGTTSAESLPIPILVLACLGTALLLSSAGLIARKRLKARGRQRGRAEGDPS
jgi:hypothetical protein